MLSRVMQRGSRPESPAEVCEKTHRGATVSHRKRGPGKASSVWKAAHELISRCTSPSKDRASENFLPQDNVVQTWTFPPKLCTSAKPCFPTFRPSSNSLPPPLPTFLSHPHGCRQNMSILSRQSKMPYLAYLASHTRTGHIGADIGRCAAWPTCAACTPSAAALS